MSFLLSIIGPDLTRTVSRFREWHPDKRHDATRPASLPLAVELSRSWHVLVTGVTVSKCVINILYPSCVWLYDVVCNNVGSGSVFIWDAFIRGS